MTTTKFGLTCPFCGLCEGLRSYLLTECTVRLVTTPDGILRLPRECMIDHRLDESEEVFSYSSIDRNSSICVYLHPQEFSPTMEIYCPDCDRFFIVDSYLVEEELEVVEGTEDQEATTEEAEAEPIKEESIDEDF